MPSKGIQIKKNGGQQSVKQKNFGNQRNGSDYHCQNLHQQKNGNGYRSNPSNYKPGESNGRNTRSAGADALTTQSTCGRLTAISTREAEGAKDVVTGTFLVNSVPVNVLFDTGASNSFVSASIIKKLRLKYLEPSFYVVAIPSGELYQCTRVYKSVPLTIEGTIFPSDLYELVM